MTQLRICCLMAAISLLSFSLAAQLPEKEFHYGFSAGVSFASMSDINTSLIRPIFPIESYSTNHQMKAGFSGGSFIFYRFKKSKFSIQPEIIYQDMGGIFHYEDVNELSYDISFNYSYIGIAPIVKYYTVGGLNIHTGPQMAFIVNRSDLSYTSNQPELGPDLQIQQSLREVLKGNNNVSLMLGVGYDLPMGLGLDIRCNFGISDAMETLANGFYFIENKNVMRGYSATLRYAIPFY